MNLVQRVQDILLKPKQTWPQIEAEPSSVASIYKDYLVYLAAIPALAAFIGLSLIGVGGFGVSFRVPIVAGLVNMLVGYVLSLVMVLVLSLVVDALAPTFGGSKTPSTPSSWWRSASPPVCSAAFSTCCRRWPCSACWWRCIPST